MNEKPKIKLLDRIYNLTNRREDDKVKGYCCHCGNPLFQDYSDTCVYCREAMLIGAEMARKIISETYKDIIDERKLRRQIREELNNKK